MLRRMRGARPAPGLVTGRVVMLGELDTVTGGMPNPVRYGLLTAWETAAARDAFRRDGALRFADGAHEAWSVSLDPVRAVRGDIMGWLPDTTGAERLARDEPLAIITYARLRARHTVRFTTNNRRIVREMTPLPGLLMMTGLLEHPMTRATFSLWRSQGDAVRFAYGTEGTHKPVQRKALAVPWGDDFAFARFRPLDAGGTWGGRDPLAPG